MEDCNILVSVIIPTYRGIKRLKESIDSALNQSWKNIEVLVVDDNGVDTKDGLETQKFMTIYSGNSKVKYIQHLTNKNGSAARNTGIKAAKGEYIAFLDDDDCFDPQKIEKQLIMLKKMEKIDSSYKACYCGFTLKEGDKVLKRYSTNSQGNLLSDLLLGRNSICAGSTLFIEKECIDKTGYFDETFKRFQDWEFMVRFFRYYKIGVVSDSLVDIYTERRKSSYSKAFAEKTICAQKMFLEKYKNDIDALAEKDDIYRAQYSQLITALLMCKQYDSAMSYIKAYSSSFKIIDWIRFFVSWMDSKTNIKSTLMSILYKLK